MEADRLKLIRCMAMLAVLLMAYGCNGPNAAILTVKSEGCSEHDTGIALPPGFCASLFADGLGHIRHMVVATDGTVFANSMAGREGASRGAGIVMLRDRDGDGRAEEILRPIAGQQGGTGIALRYGFLFVENGNRIDRYRLDGTTLREGTPGEIVLSGLAEDGDHRSNSLAVAGDGALYISAGSASNACQLANRQPRSPGRMPCDEKQLRAGIWRFSANALGQIFSPRQRYATGIRNAVGLALDEGGHLFATQHGRDQLRENWSDLYSATDGQELPAEELVQARQGDDFGWPECYFDLQQARLVLAPEYGGDGGRAVGVCARRKPPVAAFPAHCAPNAVLIYEGRQFPAAYRGGAFIAFHGSWNRAPGPQGGFNIVFQPLKGGRANGRYVVFADGFAGPGKAQGDAEYRPTGLAVGPDGALFISDDRKGRIWRVTYRGDPAARIASAAIKEANPDALNKTEANSPSSLLSADAMFGRRLYLGEIAGASCAGCHGPAGEGTTNAAGRWCRAQSRAGCSLGGLCQIHGEIMIILSDEVEDVSTSAGGTMRVHLFRPAREGRFPALLFYSEIYQVTGPIRRLAGALAGQGFVVGVPEVYHEYEVPGTVLPYSPEGTDRGNALKILKPLSAFNADAQAGLDFLASHSASSGALGTIGKCLGGHLALRAAFDPRVKAAVCLYPTDVHSGTLGEGRSDDTLARLGELKAEALFVWGRQDPHVPFEGRERIRARLEAVGASYEWLEFNAAHAFMRDEGPRYDPALAARALAAAVELFRQTLLNTNSA